MLVLSHPTGNANSRAAALGLAQRGQLAAFHTCIATFPGSALDHLGGLPGLRELRRREFPAALRGLTHLWPWREGGRLLASRLRMHSWTAHETGPFSVDAVYQSLDAHVAATLRQRRGRGITGVYAYEDGAQASFEAAKALGIACFYDLPIGYWRAARRLLAVEHERWPEWASTMTGFVDSDKKLARKDRELELADRIFVASSFTKKTLQDFPGRALQAEVIPYGFPPAAASKAQAPDERGPLKLLFVGGLSQRKGIADLFAAVDAIGDAVSLTVVGGKAGPPNAALDAALLKHRWIPSLPHAEVLAQMRAHDVLVFPSLFEGFGLVITEAMSQGTPVITTDRTAGADLIVHGHNGWLVDAGSTASLRRAIEALVAQPAQIAQASEAALATARQRPWAVYEHELASALVAPSPGAQG
jgi:glycosyltransferase involved in cell wall biosynthesis